jgi:hypothetical protein
MLPAAQRGGLQRHILRRKAHACQQRFGFPAQAIAFSKGSCASTASSMVSG